MLAGPCFIERRKLCPWHAMTARSLAHLNVVYERRIRTRPHHTGAHNPKVQNVMNAWKQVSRTPSGRRVTAPDGNEACWFT
jgi:hypothetical protein